MQAERRHVGDRGFLSRDDAAHFIPAYIEQKILADDPFQTLDQEGVGELIKIATERGRATRPGMKMGICGEHGGDPASIDFCVRVGLSYVSCARILGARPLRTALHKKGKTEQARGESPRACVTSGAPATQPRAGCWPS